MKSLIIITSIIILASCANGKEAEGLKLEPKVVENESLKEILPTATRVPEPTATRVPEPTATRVPEPTATRVPEPTATRVPEPTATRVPEPTATRVPEPKTYLIDISGFIFNNSDISINVNSTVIWTNKDSSVHTATSLNSKFDSGYLSINDKYSFKFINAGIYNYKCSLHSSMRGIVKVFSDEGTLIDPTPTPRPTATPSPSDNTNHGITPPPSSGDYGY